MLGRGRKPFEDRISMAGRIATPEEIDAAWNRFVERTHFTDPDTDEVEWSLECFAAGFRAALEDPCA